MMTGNSEIRTAAEILFDSKFRERGWTDQDFSCFSGWAIREAVIAIAAGGEQAAMRLILGHFAGFSAIPQLGPDGRAVSPLLDLAMSVIQQARHEIFPGNTGWTWDEESRRWTARRGTALITASYPRDEMPPFPADRLAVQVTGNRHGRAVQILDDPGEAAMPWGQPVLAEVPEEFWTDGWRHGVRYRTYLGNVCSHSGPESRACIQLRTESQAEGDEALCIPVDPDHIRLIVLSGKLADYR